MSVPKLKTTSKPIWLGSANTTIHTRTVPSCNEIWITCSVKGSNLWIAARLSPSWQQVRNPGRPDGFWVSLEQAQDAVEHSLACNIRKKGIKK